MKVLVGFDDSAGGWDALALVRTLAAFTECEALLVDVLPGPEPAPVPYRILPAERLREDAGAPLETARTSLRGVEVETRTVVGGSPARALHDLAEMESAELVVVGSPHRGPLGRTFVGSVAEGLLHGSPAPVAIAPRGYRGNPHGAPRVIAVAYDGSAEAKRALVHAQTLAATAGAAIRILSVAEPAAVVPGVAGYTPPLGLNPGDLIPAALASVDPELEAEGRELAGAPAAALAKACEDGVDLLVTGSRGYGPLGRVFVGSASASLICHSPCPVIVVPRAKRGSRGEQEVALSATRAADGKG
jgi:nucleotide-binding universal stress UspA family protein